MQQVDLMVDEARLSVSVRARGVISGVDWPSRPEAAILARLKNEH